MPQLFEFSGAYEEVFGAVEEVFSKVAVTRLASLISCSEYGLTETELLEILMPTSNSEAVITIESGNFNFSSLCSIRRKMRRCF